MKTKFNFVYDEYTSEDTSTQTAWIASFIAVFAFIAMGAMLLLSQF